ncbi:MAG TPA: hypothetical protein VFQ65_08225 [Kofleriaceae bacterium]|nr:hypothetical protein [Kofleriaceae bacterium]
MRAALTPVGTGVALFDHMRTLWIVLGGLAAVATAAGIVYVVRSRRRAVEPAQDLEPFDIVEAELIEIEAIPVYGST